MVIRPQHRFGFWIIPFALPLLFCPPAFASDVPLTAAKVLSGEELALSDGQTIRLEGIKSPFPETKDLADQAKTALENLVTGKTIALDHVSTDRYGRTSAQIFVAEANKPPIHIQSALLQAGVAFVYPPTGFEAHLDEIEDTYTALYRLEHPAKRWKLEELEQGLDLEK